MQYIDARDLAAWMLHALESGITGTYNLTGQPTTLGETLSAAATGEIIYISPEDAKNRGVDPQVFAWSVPDDRAAIWDVNIERVLASGLRLRSIAETVKDTVAWHRSRAAHEWKAGLSPEQEALLVE
jgi:nucleoside-diphosphate-sugar epimerase